MIDVFGEVSTTCKRDAVKMLPLSLLPFLLATLLSLHGLRKKSLSPSGALTAFLVGFLMMEGASYTFGITLIGFYLIGSRVTKCEYFRNPQRSILC